MYNKDNEYLPGGAEVWASSLKEATELLEAQHQGYQVHFIGLERAQ
jgi:hypothetical protein